MFPSRADKQISDFLHFQSISNQTNTTINTLMLRMTTVKRKAREIHMKNIRKRKGDQRKRKRDT